MTLNEQAKRLLDAPSLTQTQQGIDTYPRVIRQDDRSDGYQQVTLALPGLRRARVLVPETMWVNGEHYAIHAALMSQLAKCSPPIDFTLEREHGYETDLDR